MSKVDQLASEHLAGRYNRLNIRPQGWGDPGYGHEREDRWHDYSGDVFSELEGSLKEAAELALEVFWTDGLKKQGWTNGQVESVYEDQYQGTMGDPDDPPGMTGRFEVVIYGEEGDVIQEGKQEYTLKSDSPEIRLEAKVSVISEDDVSMKLEIGGKTWKIYERKDDLEDKYQHIYKDYIRHHYARELKQQKVSADTPQPSIFTVITELEEISRDMKKQ